MASSNSVESLSTVNGASEDRVCDELVVPDTLVLLALAGPSDATFRAVSQETGVQIGLRGSSVLLAGSGEAVQLVKRFFSQAADTVGRGVRLSTADCVRALRWMRRDPGISVGDVFSDLVVITPNRRTVAPKSPNQKHYMQSILAHDLTFGIGPAGTGKTYLAMAMAVQALGQRSVKRIVLARPAVEAGERLGFLPGDLADKVNPYLRPLYDALHDMMDFDKAQAMMERGQIEVAPLAFMRGRTLNDCFVILDEAQNTTSDQMRMFLTRLGHASKAVVTGDITQVDLPAGHASGLSEAWHLLRGIDGIGFCALKDSDVVRHPLVQRIIVAYESRPVTTPAHGGRSGANATRAAEPANGGGNGGADG